MGGRGERGEQRALARHCSVLGCLGPPLFSCCHSLTLGVSPAPRGAGGVLAEAGWAEMRDALRFGVGVPAGSPVTARARGFGAPKFALPPQPAAPAPAAAGEGGGSPRGGLGSISGAGARARAVRAGCVLRVSVLGGLWGAQGWGLEVLWGCRLRVRVWGAHLGCRLGTLGL